MRRVFSKTYSLRILVWGASLICALVSLGLIVWSIHSITEAPDSGTQAAWFQVLIAAFGFPLVIFGLFSLTNQLRQNRWKPEIQIGIAPGNQGHYEIKALQSLPVNTTIGQGYMTFYLVIRNTGKLAAKFVKIHLEHSSFKEKALDSSARLVRLEPMSNNGFEQESNMDFVYQGGTQGVIYPQDTVLFFFGMGTSIIEDPVLNISRPPVPRDYLFQCTVWADGLDSPVSQPLKVTVRAKPTLKIRTSRHSIKAENLSN